MANKQLRIAVIGAGPSGLFLTIPLTQMGFENVFVFEKARSLRVQGGEIYLASEGVKVLSEGLGVSSSRLIERGSVLLLRIPNTF